MILASLTNRVLQTEDRDLIDSYEELLETLLERIERREFTHDDSGRSEYRRKRRDQDTASIRQSLNLLRSPHHDP